MATGPTNVRTIADLVRRKLDEARDTLIERNLRNRLVNCALTSTRSRQIRVVDEVPDEIFRALLGQKKEFTFGAGRGIADEPPESVEADLLGWTPPVDEPESGGGVSRRHRDNVLQTQYTPEGLQKRLTSLYYEAREVEEEQGVNVLYLALGFLKWFESGNSEVERFAPLILLPVELTREGARDRFKLKVRDEDLFTNVSLRAWLAEQHSVQLPEFPDSEEWSPSDYFKLVSAAIAKSPRWEVLESEVLLGFFSFNKYLLWRDLDPKNWPNPDALLGHQVLRTLFAPSEADPVSEPPVIPHDERIDNVVSLSELTYVLDADSSQTTAIQTALAGRNLVIQGPPGTGKSQTIANVVAAAIAKGKSVLFVAEKMAALQVVYDRLKSVGLGHLCLELHSRKASKQQVLNQLRQAIDAPTPPRVPADLGTSLDRCADDLWQHSDRMHTPIESAAGLTPFEVIGRICRLKDRGVAIPDFRVNNECLTTRQRIDKLLDECRVLAKQLQLAGVPARHPWRRCKKDSLSPIDQERLAGLASNLVRSLNELVASVDTVWPLVRPVATAEMSEVGLGRSKDIRQALLLASAKPDEPMELLCNPRWRSDLAVLEALLANTKSLSEHKAKLESVFLASAWDVDWTSIRVEIVGSGESLFRIFRSAYRNAVRSYRGHCKSFPPTHDGRVKSLDSLIEAIALRKAFESRRDQLRDDLGSLVDVLPDHWERLAVLVGWLRKALVLEPTLSVRNIRLLTWSEKPSDWAERLNGAYEKTVEALLQVAAFVQLDEPSVSTDIRNVEWTIGETSARVRAWEQSIERFNEWPPVREGLLTLEQSTDALFTRNCYVGAVAPGDLVGRVEMAAFEQLWQTMSSEDPGLPRMDGRLLNDTVGRFRELDRKRIHAAADEVAKKHHDQKPTGTVGDMAVIRAELNKSRRHLPVRKLIDVAGHAVQQLKPVFLMSPLSVAQYLRPGKLSFDLLLIDEASQVRPADALGAVSRATQVVVVGDAKQLPPTNFFNRMVADEDTDPGIDQEEGADVSAPLGAMESILSLCDSVFTNREMLSWHYRSQHPGLIAVSNRNFYDNKLLLPPSILVDKASDGLGVVFHQSPSGGYERGRGATNVVEADIVADAVCRFARQYPERSLGVGTFSVSQRDAIRARIDARRREAPELEPFFSTNRPGPFFVKNLESIQGDERDVIFISVGYGRDRDGRLTQNFGPINAAGGERRLNVLISRARERCEVFSPITSDDIDVSNRKPGTVALREFLQYAQKGYFDVPQRTDKDFDSDFEESVAEFLRGRGLVVHPQVGMAGFYIDLGVIDAAQPGRYVLGVECDGATYHSSRSARDRDRLRQDILESRGWTIHRVWSTDWFHRRAQEQNRLVDAVERAVREGAVRRPPQPRPEPVHDRGLRASVPKGTVVGPASTPYVEADFHVRSNLAPHEAPASTVDDAMLRILQVEAPIHQDEACRRLATVWGLERAGSRIADAGANALKRLAARGHCIQRDGFWEPTANHVVVVRDRSAAASTALRQARYLPPTEIHVAVTEIVAESARVHIDELVVEIARRLGFQRTGQELQQSIRAVVDGAAAAGVACDSDGYYTLQASVD